MAQSIKSTISLEGIKSLGETMGKFGAERLAPALVQGVKVEKGKSNQQPAQPRTAPMAAATPVLGALGWGSAGVQAGSVAAGIQGANIAAGGWFATLQSAAMGGYGVAAVSTAVQATTIAATGLVTGVLARKKGEAANGEDKVDGKVKSDVKEDELNEEQENDIENLL